MPRFSNAREAMEHERAAQEVSPENSPGHPANAPVPDESPEPQSTPAASDESTGSTGDRTAERVREAMNQKGASSTTENGVIVARDSNGYVTVRNADSSSDGYGSQVTFRSDGSVFGGNGGDASSPHSAEALPPPAIPSCWPRTAACTPFRPTTRCSATRPTTLTPSATRRCWRA